MSENHSLQGLKQAALIAAMAFGAAVGAGSTAEADEFIVMDSSGQALRNVSVEIRNPLSRSVSTLHTDWQGRLVVPDLGRRSSYMLFRDSMSAEISVDGARSLKPVVLQ